ncbi:MAG: DUF1641 domain-containing protein [Kineosporiaceae bacterium]|nr:DUF1641 domain-containing protein [Kineosporiaceae bacterium]
MSTATTGPATPAVPDDAARTAQLDRIETSLVALAEEVHQLRAERDRWRELTHELMPVAQGAMSLASRELEDLSGDVTIEDLARFARTAARALPQLEALMAQVGPASELVHEVTSLTGAGVGALSASLARAEERGYFTFARGGAAILDQVVASFGEEDLRALGANVVLILETVKQMTQPEVMRFLSQTVEEVKEDHGPPPSTLALIRQLRDPQVRRGLGRALTVLHDFGAATSRTTPAATTPEKE